MIRSNILIHGCVYLIALCNILNTSNANVNVESGSDIKYQVGFNADAFSTGIRNLQADTSVEYDSHKCTGEWPAKLLRTKKHEIILGNDTTQFWVTRTVCCPDYKPDEYDPERCVPDCGKKCTNGICEAPDRCKCFPGFVENLDGECVHTCPIGCLNGVCHADGTCICRDGYEIHWSQKFCVPICSRGCNDKHNENCTLPEECSCINGYRRTPYSNGRCTVDVNCDNIFCSTINYGLCIAPRNCECLENKTKMRKGLCSYECNENERCDFGYCDVFGECVCRDGYIYDSQSKTCLPKCLNCRYGTCVQPGVCQCYTGYKKINGQCQIPCGGGRCKTKCVFGQPDALAICRMPGEKYCDLANESLTFCLKWRRR